MQAFPYVCAFLLRLTEVAHVKSTDSGYILQGPLLWRVCRRETLPLLQRHLQARHKDVKHRRQWRGMQSSQQHTLETIRCKSECRKRRQRGMSQGLRRGRRGRRGRPRLETIDLHLETPWGVCHSGVRLYNHELTGVVDGILFFLY